MKTIKGDLIKLAKEGKFDVIVHGCNCFNTFGAGIAAQIKNNFKYAWLADYKSSKGNYNKLGNYTASKEENLIIINAYTQYNVSRTGEDVFNYFAFKLILDKIYFNYKDYNFRFGLPLIGCGLAGGNKEKILLIINQFSNKIEKVGGTVTLVEYGA